MIRKMIKKGAVLVGVTVGLGYGANAQVDLSQSLARDTTVTLGILSNGLQYYIKPNSKPGQKVELRLVVKAGSIQENDNQQGLAHFMEHMEFNGLKHYPKNELVDYLQKIGVRFGPDLNANTGWDRTYYMLPIPTDKAGNLEKGFQILSDWAGGALITTEEVNAERHVILEELRMRNKNAQTRMMHQYLPVMLNGSRYASRTPGGMDSIVQYAYPDLISQFYHDWYRPNLMAVIVVGDVTVPKAKTLIEKYFGKLEMPQEEKERTYYHVDPYKGKKAMIVTDSETTSYAFTLMYPAHKEKIEKTLGDFRESLIKSIFAQSLNRKLRDMTQSSNPPFIAVQFSLSGSIGGISLYDQGMELNVTPVDNLQKSVTAAIGKLTDVGKYGFTKKDIEISENSYLPALENAYAERNNNYSATYTDVFAEAFMKGSPLIGIANEYNYVKELLPTITVADINTFAKEVLSVPENYFTLVTGPEKGVIQLPTKRELQQMVEVAFKQEAQQDQDIPSVTNLLDKQPEPGRITSEVKDTALRTTTYTLSNGIKVTIKTTDFQKDQVLFNGIKYGGSNLYGVKDKSNITFFANIIETMGYGQFTPAQLNDFLTGKQARVNVGMSRIADEINGSSSVKDIPTMLELTYLKLTEPRKDTMLLKGWYNKMKARLPLLKADPNNVFKDSLTRFIYSNNSLAPIVIPTEEDMGNINVGRILDIYKEQFSDAGGFHFFFVGNVDADSLKPLIEKYIASLPVGDTIPTYKDNGLRMVTGNQAFRFYKGADKKSQLLDIYHGDIKYSPDLDLKTDMLEQIMTIELLKTIREKKQWIYSGGVSASVSKLPYGHYIIEAQMPCGPEHVDSIFMELDREIAKYKQNGVSQEDVDKVKKSMIEQYRESIKENGTWISELQQIALWGMNSNDFLNFEQRLNRITPADIKSVANELLNKNNNIKVATYPGKHL